MIEHYSRKEWMQYVKNELRDIEREKLEDHLYNCDQCLEIYLDVLAEEESNLPIIVNSSSFTNDVMSSIADLKQKTDLNVKRSIFQSPLFHYVLAAAMTLLLMNSGVFQIITKYADIHDPKILGQTPSVTEGIIQSTFSLLDRFDVKKQQGGYNE